jgi:cyclase
MRRLPGFLFVVVCSAVVLSAQAPNAPLTVTQVKAGAYVAQGGAGANTGFLVGTAGVVAIDSKMTVDGAKALLGEIARVTPKPVTHIILTHSDGDHVNGLAGFPKGLPIIAHANCLKEMEASMATGAPAPAGYLPTVTAAGNQSLNLDGFRIQLLYFGRAHTSGDYVVYLPELKVAYTGDLVMPERPDPLIHAQKGGTPAGWLEVVGKVAELDADVFVPGHGAPMTKAEVRKKLASVQEKYDRIKALAAQGKSLEEIRSALGESAPPARGGRGFASYTEVTYNELSRK